VLPGSDDWYGTIGLEGVDGLICAMAFIGMEMGIITGVGSWVIPWCYDTTHFTHFSLYLSRVYHY
jgi:hypothetical protein